MAGLGGVGAGGRAGWRGGWLVCCGFLLVPCSLRGVVCFRSPGRGGGGLLWRAGLVGRGAGAGTFGLLLPFDVAPCSLPYLRPTGGFPTPLGAMSGLCWRRGLCARFLKEFLKGCKQQLARGSPEGAAAPKNRLDLAGTGMRLCPFCCFRGAPIRPATTKEQNSSSPLCVEFQPNS